LTGRGDALASPASRVEVEFAGRAPDSTLLSLLDLLGLTRRMAAAIVVGAVGAIVALAFGHGS